MYEFIKGRLVEKNPTYAVIEAAGIGYYIHISLHTYTQLGKEEEARLFLHQLVREDAISLFGFFDAYEREMFRKLIGVSGVGAGTARMILSSLTPAEVYAAISSADVNTLKSVKGIGAKSAQRIIVDLKDKLDVFVGEADILPVQHNTLREEALSALLALGFSKQMAEKALQKVLKANSTVDKVEVIIKETLKVL